MQRPSFKAVRDDTLFREEQGFTQWFIWALVLGLVGIPLYGIVQQIFLGEPFGDHPMSDWGLILFLTGTLLFCYFFWSVRLRTAIARDHVHIQFRPLANKKVYWRDVSKAEIVRYSPWIGYGLRVSTTYGTVYNTKGNKGLLLTLKEGKKIMIGTQRPREMEEAAQRAMKAIKAL
ncbi:hypothetical protein [Muriicola sp.]